MFNKINNSAVSQNIISQIQHQIIKGNLVAGDKLPSERDLTSQFNASRASIREALKSLEVLGLIESKQGDGNYITNNVTSSFYVPSSLSFKLSEGKLEEVVEYRQLIETFAVSKAVKTATEEDILELKNLQEKMITSKSNKKKIHYDFLFHNKIIELSQNNLIISSYENACFLMENFIENFPLKSINDVENVYSEHMEIIRYIEERELAKACEAVKLHLKSIDIK